LECVLKDRGEIDINIGNHIIMETIIIVKIKLGKYKPEVREHAYGFS